MAQSRLEQRIRAANAAGRKALIPFLPGGYPERERFWNEITALDEAGADIIEIGVPFSDPVADGPVVEEASLTCIESGVCLEWILKELMARRSKIRAEIVLMGYMNPFYQYGLQRFAADAAEAGVAGIIIPDVPLEEAREFRAELDKVDIALIPLIGLNTSRERMEQYAAVSSGFVYLVSVLGITGARDSLPEKVRGQLAEAREAFDLPLALGFGIKTPAQLEPFAEHLDAVVFGSALIQHIREGQDAADFMKRWR